MAPSHVHWPNGGTPPWTRRRFFGLAAGSAALLTVPPLLAGCSGLPFARPATAPATPPPATTAQPRRGGTLRIAFSGSAQRLDPATMTLNEEYNVTLAIYNNLVRVDPQLRPQPELATSWQSSDDLKTWTFSLRQGVRFHHGKVFNADDVVFTFRRLLDPRTASAARSILSFMEGVEKTDDHTVLFHLKQANADLPMILGFAQGRILPSDRGDEQIAREPSGTGPFRFKELVPGDRVTMVRNPDYWEPGLPYLDEVRHVTMPEQASQTAALTGGTIEMIWQLNLEAKPTLDADPGVVVAQVESGGYQPIVMRSDRPPFDDNRLRLAMKYVVDRPQMRQAVLLGLGSLGTDHPIPPVNPFYSDQGIRQRDVEKARQLLKEAGYPDGINLTLYTTAGRPGLVEQAVAFKEMAAPAGIRIDVQKVPNSVYWADYWMKKDFIVSNWNFRPTVDETLSTAYHSEAKWNEAHWKSPKLDDLIVGARGVRDADRRKQLYAEAAKILMDEGPVVVAFFRPMISAMRKSVHGFQVHPATWMDVRSTWMEG
ncbi:MAG: ABC transporter substrate-binding protein [Chloroflexi bacterium]|nr:ABC transporter substrate-binding protein [Chloroflexota bacterium]